MQIKLEDVTLDVLDEGEGTPLVLLHAFPLNKETWDEQAAALRGRARVIRFDFRGLGASSVPPGPYLMSTLAGDLAGVLDALGVERAIVAGHSLGGYVAFAFARMFNERLLGLGLLAANARADEADRKLWRYGMAERVEREGMAPLVDAYLGRLFAGDVYEGSPGLVRRARGILERTDPHGAAALLRGIAERDDAGDLFADVTVPTAVIAGTHDGFVSVAEAERIVAGIRGAELCLLDCGHLPLWEAPDAATASLGALLSRVEALSPA